MKRKKQLILIASALITTVFLTACDDSKDVKTDEGKIETDILAEKVEVSTAPVKKDTEAPIEKIDEPTKTTPQATQPTKTTPQVTQPTKQDINPVILDGEPMDNHGDLAPSLLSENDKVGYIKEVVRDKPGEFGKVTLSVDFAEIEFNEKYTTGYKLENKEKKIEKITFEKEPIYYVLNGTKLSQTTIEDINATKKGNVLFDFLYTDEGVVFMIEERYLP